MAGEATLVDKTTLTELCANTNTGANRFCERSHSRSRATENISGEHTAAGCLTMGSYLQPSRALDAPQEPPKQDDSYPSSLRSTSTSCTSYSLEISESTTTTNNNSKKEYANPLPLKTPPESSVCQNSMALGPLVPGPSATRSYQASNAKPLQEKEKTPESKCPDKIEIVMSPSIVSDLEKAFLSSPLDNGKVGAQPSQPPRPNSTRERLQLASSSSETLSSDLSASPPGTSQMCASRDEGDAFYAFVILHAQEDADEASKLKSRVESISSTTGATFSEDFEVPGQSTFRCVEDAIENSAFVMLMLTPHFKNRLNEVNADSALMNSIDKPHKYNTVIPVLPRVNSLRCDQIPLALRTRIPLCEKKGKMFEMKVQKLLDLTKIEKQKSIWRQEREIKKQREAQQRLKEQRRLHKDILQESTRVRELEKEIQQLQMQQQRLPAFYPQPPNPIPGAHRTPHPPLQSPMPSYCGDSAWPQQPSNIRIQNAKYIMVGNNSTMTVGGAVDSGDEDDF